MRVVTVPCLRDNFAYLVGAEGERSVVVVDPSEAGPVVQALSQHQLSLCGILCTHHHHDHIGGNVELIKRFGPLPVYAHESDQNRIPEQNTGLSEGQTVTAAGLSFRVLFIPGHTQGQVAYLSQGVVFVGDTLFGAGCGRLREGTAAQLWSSLERLAQLPDETLVYFGHEYTVANLNFAQSVEPKNANLQARQERARELRAAGLFTTPSTIGEEKRTNPFLRTTEPEVVAHFSNTLGSRTDPVSVFAAARAEKDQFRG